MPLHARHSRSHTHARTHAHTHAHTLTHIHTHTHASTHTHTHLLAVRHGGRGQIPVCLQCERNVACLTRGPSESRQASARARGGARNLQERLSGLIVDSVPHALQVFVHFQPKLDQQELDRLDPTLGLMRAGLLHRRVCVSRGVCARACVCVRVCVCARVYVCVCVFVCV